MEDNSRRIEFNLTTQLPEYFLSIVDSFKILGLLLLIYENVDGKSKNYV